MGHKKVSEQQEKTAPVITSLQVTNKISILMDEVQKNLNKCNVKQYSRFFDAGMEEDEFKEMSNFNTELYYLYANK